MEQIIDTALYGCKDYISFIRRMQEAGCEVKQGKHLAFKAPGQDRFIRLKSLGANYTEYAIRERISGKRVVAPKKKSIAPSLPVGDKYKPNLLIDIQAKLQQARSPGFEHWTQLYNLKESARTLIFLQERGLDSYEALVKITAEVGNSYSGKTTRIKEIEARLKDISELQRQIGNYGKHRETYAEYLRLKKSSSDQFSKIQKCNASG